jgi:Tfp pilus assembly protein PilX
MNRPPLRRLQRLGRERGIVGMVALMFIVIVVFFAMTEAARISSSNLIDSARQSDSVDALFLAESAIERVGYLFVNDSTHTCSDAAIGTGTDYTLGRGVFRVVQTFTTDYSGATLPTTMCRVRVQGEITGTGIKRTIDTIVGTTDDVISISSLNPNLNDVPWEGSRTGDESHVPTSWNLSASTAGTGSMLFIPWDHLGGNDDDDINGLCKTTGDYCDRGLFLRKTDTGSGTATAGGAFNTTGTPINVTIPSTGSKTLRLTFDFRVWGRSGSSAQMYFSPMLVFTINGVTTNVEPSTSIAAGGDCASTSQAGWCDSDRTYTATQAAWSGSYGKGCGYTDTPCFESGPADATCPTYDPSSSYIGITGTASGQKAGTYAQCSDPSNKPPQGTTGYKTGYLTYVVSCAGGCTATLTSVSLTRSSSRQSSTNGLQAKSGGINWIWVDNLRLSVPAISGGGPSKLWREVATP